MGLGPTGEPVAENLRTPDVSWLEPAELLETSPAAVSSALQRARATLEASELSSATDGALGGRRRRAGRSRTRARCRAAPTDEFRNAGTS